MLQTILTLFPLGCASTPAQAPKTVAEYTDEATGLVLDPKTTAFLDQAEQDLITCYMDTLANPSDADATLEMQYVIDAKGAVSRAIIRHSNITHPAFQPCAEEATVGKTAGQGTGNEYAISQPYRFKFQ